MVQALQDKARQAELSPAENQRLEAAKADEDLLKAWKPGQSLEASWKAQVQQRLAANQDLLDLLSAAAAKPAIRWRVTDDSRRPLAVDPQPIMMLGRLMLVRAAMELEEERFAQGLKDLGVVYRMGYQVRQCPAVIYDMRPIEPSLVEASLLLDASSVLQRALPKLRAAPEEFGQLIGQCQGGPIASVLKTAADFTMALLNDSYTSSLNLSYPWYQEAQIWVFRPYIDSSHAQMLETLACASQMIEGSFAQFIGKTEQHCLTEKGGRPRNWAAAWFISAASAQAVSESLRGMSQVALAMRSWQLAHDGALPQSIHDVADMLPQMPVDQFTDAPLGYLRDVQQPRIYSAGLDRKDNLGACDIQEDAFGQKGHDICFYLTGLPAGAAPASAPASAPTTQAK